MQLPHRALHSLRHTSTAPNNIPMLSWINDEKGRGYATSAVRVQSVERSVNIGVRIEGQTSAAHNDKPTTKTKIPTYEWGKTCSVNSSSCQTTLT